MTGLGKYISKKDLLTIFEIIQEALSCKEEKGYRQLVCKFNNILSFDSFISGLVDTQKISYKSLVADSFNIGYPDGYYETYLNLNYHLMDPLYQRFFKTFDIQNSWELKSLYKNGAERNIKRLRDDFQVKNIFLCGVRDLNMDSFTILSLAGKRLKSDRRTHIILKHMLPYLSIAIKKLFPPISKADIIPLKPKELEVLKWLKEGKSSWEISVILNITEVGINFYIGNLLKKLNATNRTHAVAIALENRLFSI